MSAEATALDTLASLARTALDDPHALPIPTPGEGPCIAYAIDRLDDLIETVNPSEGWTRENAARALRVLGTHMAAVADGLMDVELNTAAREDAACRIQVGLDEIDRAIEALTPEPDDGYPADNPTSRLAATDDPAERQLIRNGLKPVRAETAATLHLAEALSALREALRDDDPIGLNDGQLAELAELCADELVRRLPRYALAQGDLEHADGPAVEAREDFLAAARELREKVDA